MTYIKILEPRTEIRNILTNIISAEHAENICINEKDSDGKTEVLCAANAGGEIDLKNYTNLKIIIAGVKDAVNIKNIPPDIRQIQMITCGWEGKNTFTYSSVNDDELIFNLQRKITSLSDSVVYPFEMKVEREKYGIKKQNDEDILFAFCIYHCL